MDYDEWLKSLGPIALLRFLWKLILALFTPKPQPEPEPEPILAVVHQGEEVEYHGERVAA